MEGFNLRSLLNPEHWLAMDSDNRWKLFKEKPDRGGWNWYDRSYDEITLRSDFFNLPECENWECSLIQVKGLIKD